MSKRKSAQAASENLSKIAEFERLSENKRSKLPLPKDANRDESAPPLKAAKTTSKTNTSNPPRSKTSFTKLHDGGKNARGQLVFEDVPDFRPNRTPKEVLQAGSFGGTYFRPIYSSVTKKNYGSEVYEELPKDWLKGLNLKTRVASPDYDANVNKYKVKCGGSLEMWESSGWIVEQDPYGWFQWYCRFFQGRRSDDDERQIGRWQRCAGVKGRWRNNLVTKVFHSKTKKFDDPNISPVVRQTLLHWAYELTKDDYDIQAKIVAKRK